MSIPYGSDVPRRPVRVFRVFVKEADGTLFERWEIPMTASGRRTVAEESVADVIDRLKATFLAIGSKSPKLRGNFDIALFTSAARTRPDFGRIRRMQENELYADEVLRGYPHVFALLTPDPAAHAAASESSGRGVSAAFGVSGGGASASVSVAVAAAAAAAAAVPVPEPNGGDDDGDEEDGDEEDGDEEDGDEEDGDDDSIQICDICGTYLDDGNVPLQECKNCATDACEECLMTCSRCKGKFCTSCYEGGYGASVSGTHLNGSYCEECWRLMRMKSRQEMTRSARARADDDWDETDWGFKNDTLNMGGVGAPNSAWIAFVKQVKEAHGLTYKNALIKASELKKKGLMPAAAALVPASKKRAAALPKNKRAVADGGKASSCVKQHTKKYTDRKGPPYAGNDAGCRDAHARGNDGACYASRPDKNGTYRWRLTTEKSACS